MALAGQGGRRGRGRGDGERCSTAGCANKAQASGKCRTHTGMLGQCSHSDCEKQAQYKGLCVAHGGRRICTYADCSKTVTSKGKCAEHGGGRRRLHLGSRRPKRSDEGAKGSSAMPIPDQQSHVSMMSLLLNEWPQEAALSGDSQVSAWTGDRVKLSTVVSPADSVGAVAPTSFLGPQEQHSSGSFPQSGVPDWTAHELDGGKFSSLVSAAAVMPTVSHQGQTNGSMMSLLLGGWSHGMATDGEVAIKTEEEYSAVGTTDSETSTDRADNNAAQARNPRKRALCIHQGCIKIAQSQGLCVSHGGKRCLHPGCTKSAQYQGLCTTHGGSRTCTYPGCTKTIRSSGRCFEHGGGKQCSHSECTKQAQSSGLCSAHRKK